MDHLGRRASRRRSHRLSTDSSVTLPSYSQSAHSQRRTGGSVYSDKPPDYHQSQSADEADLDESDDNRDFLASPSSFRQRQSPSYNSRRPHNQASSSTVDPLDALLARSVHALELSNVLLQSTMTTRSNLSASMAHDRIVDRNLEMSAAVLNNRIRDTSNSHADWIDGLDEVVRDVRDLYGDTDSVSRSLPSGSMSASSPPLRSLGSRVGPEEVDGHHRRRSSHSHYDDPRPRLRLSSSPPRGPRQFMSPPPRAMTQYVSITSERGDAEETTADDHTIFMPSTIGLQSSSHLSSFRAISDQRRPEPLHLHHTNSSSPGLMQYGRRSSFEGAGGGARNSGSPRRIRPSLTSPLSAGSSRPSFASSSPSRRSVRSSSDSQRHPQRERTNLRTSFSPRIARSRSSSDSSTRGRSRSRSQTPSARSRSDSANTLLHVPVLPQTRPMTPPMEESLPEEVSSSDNSGPNVTRTLESLRKILDVASPRKDDKPQSAPPVIKKVPSFLMPRSPVAKPLAGTSTATATVSRLFTKGTHSTRDTPPSRPSLKLPGGSPRDSVILSAPSSGRSTPRQVIFAQLPEPYSAEGTRRGFNKPRSKSKSKHPEKEESPPGFWSMLFGAATPAAGMRDAARIEDRVEDRMARSWARSGSGQSTMEDFLY